MRSLFVGMCVISTVGCSSPPPTDAKLTTTFESKQSAFVKLKARLCQTNEKRIVMMEPEWSQPTASEEERAEFYALFKEIGASGVYYDGNCSFRLPVWSVGFAGGGDYKGYSYNPQEHWRGVLTSQPLDEIDRSNQQRIFASRALKGDWYLYLQHWP